MEDSDGRLLSLAAEAMLRVFSGGVYRVIYHSTYIGIVFRSLIFETSIFLTNTFKIRESTTSTILRQPIFHYEDSVCDPQTLALVEINLVWPWRKIKPVV